MTVTSARHCGIFISTTVSSAEIFPTWENYLGSMRGWEGEMGREAGLWPSCIPLPTLVVSVLLSILTFSPFTLVIFIFLFLPPLLLLSSSNTELKQWCDLSPCHSFIFIGYFSPSSSFFFLKFKATWRLTHCWQSATQWETVADLGQVKKTSNISFPPYLG